MIVLTAGLKPVDYLAVGSGGRSVAAATYSKKPTLCRIDQPEKPVRLKAGESTSTVGLRFAADGTLLAHWDDQLAGYDPATGKELWAHTLREAEYSYGHAFTGGGGRLFVTYIKDDRSQPDRELWEVRGEKKPKRLWSKALGGGGASAASAFLAGSEVIAVAFVTNQRDCNLTVQFTDAETGKLRHSVAGRGNWAAKLAGTPDGPLAALVWTVAVTVYDLDKPEAPIKLVNDGKKHFTDAAFHPTGRFLAAASSDATVKLYDTRSWKPARTFTWKIGKMRSIAFSPDGLLAAAGSDSGKIVVWDVDL